MSNFFNDEQLNNITLTKDIDNVKDFSSVKLGDLPRYEDLYKKEIVPIKAEDLSEFNKEDISPVLDRTFKKQEDKEKALVRARVKIYLIMFALITLLITGFVIYNLIAMMILNNKIENNDVKINGKQQQIEREQEQSPVNKNLDFELPKDISLNL